MKLEWRSQVSSEFSCSETQFCLRTMLAVAHPLLQGRVGEGDQLQVPLGQGG